MFRDTWRKSKAYKLYFIKGTMERINNYNSFLRLNVKGYSNKWIALVDGEIVSTKNSFKEVYHDTKRRFPNKRPMITKIPGKKVMILYFS